MAILCQHTTRWRQNSKEKGVLRGGMKRKGCSAWAYNHHQQWSTLLLAIDKIKQGGERRQRQRSAKRGVSIKGMPTTFSFN